MRYMAQELDFETLIFQESDFDFIRVRTVDTANNVRMVMTSQDDDDCVWKARLPAQTFINKCPAAQKLTPIHTQHGLYLYYVLVSEPQKPIKTNKNQETGNLET